MSQIIVQIIMFIIARTREPSSMAGLSGAAVGGGMLVPPQYQVYFHIAAVMLGALAYFLSERGNATQAAVATQVQQVIQELAKQSQPVPVPNNDTQNGQRSPFGDTGKG